MAIEIKYAINMALQYNSANEFDLENYLVADTETGKLFLTESPTSRVLNEAEKSALYFLVDDALFNASAFYEMYNSGGTKIDEAILELGYNHLIHNSIPVNLNAFYVDPLATRMDVSIISNQDLITNGNFEQGAGDVFTGWTNDAPGGSIVQQTATGGLNGTRAVQIKSDGSYSQIYQPLLLGISTYEVSFWAKSETDLTNGLLIQYPTGSQAFSTTTEFQRFSFTFTASGSGDLQFITPSGFNTFITIDNVLMRVDTVNRLTEIKSYQIDRDCYDYSFQVNWLNKLGGRDTFMFGAKPAIETVVERNNLIELSKLTNYTSPKRIYGYREHISHKVYNLSHWCKNRATAEWLKREIIDSIDVMVVINDYYYPVMVLDSAITEDKSSHEFLVNFRFRLAFDNNIQTR